MTTTSRRSLAEQFAELPTPETARRMVAALSQATERGASPALGPEGEALTGWTRALAQQLTQTQHQVSRMQTDLSRVSAARAQEMGVDLPASVRQMTQSVEQLAAALRPAGRSRQAGGGQQRRRAQSVGDDYDRLFEEPASRRRRTRQQQQAAQTAERQAQQQAAQTAQAAARGAAQGAAAGAAQGTQMGFAGMGAPTAPPAGQTNFMGWTQQPASGPVLPGLTGAPTVGQQLPLTPPPTTPLGGQMGFAGMQANAAAMQATLTNTMQQAAQAAAAYNQQLQQQLNVNNKLAAMGLIGPGLLPGSTGRLYTTEAMDRMGAVMGQTIKEATGRPILPQPANFWDRLRMGTGHMPMPQHPNLAAQLSAGEPPELFKMQQAAWAEMEQAIAVSRNIGHQQTFASGRVLAMREAGVDPKSEEMVEALQREAQAKLRMETVNRRIMTQEREMRRFDEMSRLDARIRTEQDQNAAQALEQRRRTFNSLVSGFQRGMQIIGASSLAGIGIIGLLANRMSDLSLQIRAAGVSSRATGAELHQMATGFEALTGIRTSAQDMANFEYTQRQVGAAMRLGERPGRRMILMYSQLGLALGQSVQMNEDLYNRLSLMDQGMRELVMSTLGISPAVGTAIQAQYSYNQAMGAGVAVSEDMIQANAAQAVELNKMRNEFNELALQAGPALMEMMVALKQALLPLVEGVVTMVTANPKLVLSLLAVGAMFVGLAPILGTIATLYSAISAAQIPLTGWKIALAILAGGGLLAAGAVAGVHQMLSAMEKRALEGDDGLNVQNIREGNVQAGRELASDEAARQQQQEVEARMKSEGVRYGDLSARDRFFLGAADDMMMPHITWDPTHRAAEPEAPPAVIVPTAKPLPLTEEHIQEVEKQMLDTIKGRPKYGDYLPGIEGFRLPSFPGRQLGPIDESDPAHCRVGPEARGITYNFYGDTVLSQGIADAISNATDFDHAVENQGRV